MRLCLLLHCLDFALGETDALNTVPGDTMRRALQLAEWVKENQLKALALFSGDKSKHYSPAEKAVMEAVVSEAEQLGVDSLTIPNPRLVELVNGVLPCPVDARVIGRAATSLGMGHCLTGEKRLRARTVNSEWLERFKGHVSHVSHVSNHCTATDYGRDVLAPDTSHMSRAGE